MQMPSILPDVTVLLASFHTSGIQTHKTLHYRFNDKVIYEGRPIYKFKKISFCLFSKYEKSENLFLSTIHYSYAMGHLAAQPIGVARGAWDLGPNGDGKTFSTTVLAA